MFRNAIVRIPGENFDQGLTSSSLGKPLYARALEQHAAYYTALEKQGLRVWTLPPDLAHPDSTFVEDTAVLTKSSAILTRPGAKKPGRRTRADGGSSRAIFSGDQAHRRTRHFRWWGCMRSRKSFFIGISHRTNAEGAKQLADFLSEEGFTASFVDVRGVEGILHLKSGIACLGEKTLVVIEALADQESFPGFDLIPVSRAETYAANCLRLRDAVLLPSGFPSLASTLRQRHYDLRLLEMSEFQKMDGGLSCLSLRF